VKPSAFQYHAPRTIEDAVALLARFVDEEGRVLAGGQTLVPAMALRLARPGHLIDINGVAGLDHLAVEAGFLSIGACVRHATLTADAAPGALGRLMGAMQRHIAHAPIRARGTFCGSVANADPASEWCLLAVALDAEIEVRSVAGSRTIAADAFFLGSMSTALGPDEIITRVRVPLLPEATRTGFHEFARRAGDFAQVMAVAAFSLRDGRVEAPRVAIGGIESRPRRSPAAEAALRGADPSRANFALAAASAASALAERDPYLRALAETAVLRALASAA
jgi:carbon-monoxide dehydrogenase medium subunit